MAGDVPRRQPKPPLQPWTAWGFVIASSLPTKADIGPARIHREHGDRLNELRTPRPLMKHADGPWSMFSAIPGDVVVRSPWTVWFRVDATDADAAYNEIMAKQVPVLHAALERISDAPAVIDIVRLGIEDETGFLKPVMSPYTRPMMTRSYDETAMDAATLEEAQAAAAVVGRRSDMLAVAREFHEAHRLQLVSTSAEVAVPSALLRYFLVIEAIARAVAPKSSPDETALAEVVQRLQKDLARGGTSKQRVKQVRNAARELDRIEQRFLTLKIEAAATELSLTDEDVARIDRLARLRNTRLSHPDLSTVDGDSLAPELEPARLAAKAFMVAWIRSLSATGAH